MDYISRLASDSFRDTRRGGEAVFRLMACGAAHIGISGQPRVEEQLPAECDPAPSQRILGKLLDLAGTWAKPRRQFQGERGIRRRIVETDPNFLPLECARPRDAGEQPWVAKAQRQCAGRPLNAVRQRARDRLGRGETQNRCSWQRARRP